MITDVCDESLDMCRETYTTESSEWTLPLETEADNNTCDARGVLRISPDMTSADPVTSVMVCLTMSDPEYFTFHLADSSLADGFGE